MVLNRWALLVGAMMILQFHVMPLLAHWCEERQWTRGSKAIRTALGHTRRSSFSRSLGRHIVILNVYYSKLYEEVELSVFHSKDHQPFIESIAFAFFESVVLHRLCRTWQKKLTDYERPVVKGKEMKDVVNTKFADFSVPWSFATITFVAQFMLFSIFILDMNGDENTHCRCSMNIFHWFAAVLVTNVSGHDESGGSFRYSAWENMLTPERVSKYKVKDHPVQYWSRCFCDGTINAFCREVLLCLAPVALSVSSRDDLVKDCLAIFFISRMDDIEPREIDETLEEWMAECKAYEPEQRDLQADKTEVENGPGQNGHEEISSDRGESRDPLLDP
jgi:hypothetical protein